MKITVTQSHIDEAERDLNDSSNICSKCVIAKAIRDHFPNAEIGYLKAHLKIKKGQRNVVRLPAAARDAIRRFDAGIPVSPFTFELDVPEEVGK